MYAVPSCLCGLIFIVKNHDLVYHAYKKTRILQNTNNKSFFFFVALY